MRIVSFTEARNGLKAVLDNVINDADTTVITRRDSEDAVVMSLDYYISLMETVHLLRSSFSQDRDPGCATDHRVDLAAAAAPRWRVQPAVVRGRFPLDAHDGSGRVDYQGA